MNDPKRVDPPRQIVAQLQRALDLVRGLRRAPERGASPPATASADRSTGFRIDPAAMGPRPQIIDRRAVVIGLVLCGVVLAGTVYWKLTPDSGALRKQEEFQFSLAEPDIEKFRIEDPVRELIQERPEEAPDVAEEFEMPDIQITTEPVDVQVEQAVVRSPEISIDAPLVDLMSDEPSFEDAPLEISEVSDEVTFALAPIAADTAEPADIFSYSEPNPPSRPQKHFINRAAQPGRAMASIPRMFGDQDAPTIGRLGPADVNLFGERDFMRSMSRAGGVKARTSVDAALDWLARHQGPSGLWDAGQHDGEESASLAVTALSCLAFMGGGHTTRRGDYRLNVLKGLEAIRRHQEKDGHLRYQGSNLYTHAICTIALCEAYGRAGDPSLGEAAQKAVRFCEQAVNNDGGWRYSPQSGPSDTSVTAWFVQALKTAKLAHIKFDNALFSRGQSYVDSVTDQGASQASTGAVGYQFQPGQRYQSKPALTAAAMMIRQFSGLGTSNHLLRKAARLTRGQAPDWRRKDFYLWYYATYAMHNMGGEDRIWWNQRIRDILLANQSRSGDDAGSWDPKGDRWAKQGGRVYTTSLGALCLEVYYRYSEALNSFGTAPDLDELFFK